MTSTRSGATPGRIRHTLRALNVLLVEDNLVNQRVAQGLLQRRGHKVTVAQNGAEALDWLSREAFELVLMDLQMPVMGGIEATLAIRERERTAGGHIRIVAMTAHAMASDRERCLEAGMDGYLSKPINPTDLFNAVENGHIRETATATIDAPSDVFDRHALLYRLFGDADLMDEVIRTFLHDLPARLVSIKAAIDAGNAELLRTAAHTLKGAAGNVSATRVSEAARVLEHLAAASQTTAVEVAWHKLSSEASKFVTIMEERMSIAPPSASGVSQEA